MFIGHGSYALLLSYAVNRWKMYRTVCVLENMTFEEGYQWLSLNIFINLWIVTGGVTARNVIVPKYWWKCCLYPASQHWLYIPWRIVRMSIRNELISLCSRLTSSQNILWTQGGLLLIAQTLKITIQVSSFECCGTLQSHLMTTTFIKWSSLSLTTKEFSVTQFRAVCSEH